MRISDLFETGALWKERALYVFRASADTSFSLTAASSALFYYKILYSITMELRRCDAPEAPSLISPYPSMMTRRRMIEE
ncbi:hypothetical protein BS630_28805 [Rhizobium laguerreae]|nr:hypothetical protein BS630_28805 [Rhizobium laguerreae]